jgi:hypothetical protein
MKSPCGTRYRCVSRPAMLAVLAMTTVLACVLVAQLAGCSASPQKRLEGRGVADSTSGKKGTLSDLTLSPDMTFQYAGQNAYGGTVRFGGTWKTGGSAQGPTITLVYHDFPDKPVTWFYEVASDTLRVSTQPGNLKNGSALVFMRPK